MAQITKEENRKGGVTMFKLGQKNGKITVSPFESDEYFEYCYIVDANLFEPIPRQAKVV